jgi:aminopeptidase N
MTFCETPGIMDWLEKRTGLPLPFKDDKYYQIVAPFGGGAMENITLTTWDYWFMCDNKWAKDYKIWVRSFCYY